MGFFGLIAAVVVLLLSIALTVLISQPLTGALVRLRANYLPKAVSLDNVLEAGSQHSDGVRGITPGTISGYFLRERRSTAKIGPIVPGIFAMLIRTRKLEGWSGMYKGVAPVVCQLFVLGLFTVVFYSVGGLTVAGGGQYKAAPSGPGQFGFWSNLFFMFITSLVALPLNVITNRAIVHPRVVSFSHPRKVLGELLSFSEYSQPWRLYLTPGLLATQLMHITWIGLLTRIVRQITVPSLGGLPPSIPASPGDDTYSGPTTSNMEISSFGLACFLAWCVLSVVVLSPLECVIIRLSVQRPERQQPLHLAYARASQTAPPSGPAPYNNQAQMHREGVPNSATSQGNEQYRDTEAPAQPQEVPSRPSFAITDDDEEEGDGEGKGGGEGTLEVKGEGEGTKAQAEGQGTRGADGQQPLNKDGVNGEPANVPVAPPSTAALSTTPTHAPSVQGAPPSRVLGGGPPPVAPNPYSGMVDQPSEPVIALRPCDEPESAEEAARAEEEGFGAPTVDRYTGMIDCLNKLVDEEGIEALYRGAGVTLLFVLAGNFG